MTDIAKELRCPVCRAHMMFDDGDPQGAFPAPASYNCDSCGTIVPQSAADRLEAGVVVDDAMVERFLKEQASYYVTAGADKFYVRTQLNGPPLYEHIGAGNCNAWIVARALTAALQSASAGLGVVAQAAPEAQRAVSEREADAVMDALWPEWREEHPCESNRLSRRASIFNALQACRQPVVLGVDLASTPDTLAVRLADGSVLLDDEAHAYIASTRLPDGMAIVPEGWRLVPALLTKKMVEAAFDAGWNEGDQKQSAADFDVHAAWAAMLSAAPALTNEEVERMAAAYTGAPFASKQAIARMRRAIAAIEE